MIKYALIFVSLLIFSCENVAVEKWDARKAEKCRARDKELELKLRYWYKCCNYCPLYQCDSITVMSDYMFAIYANGTVNFKTTELCPDLQFGENKQ